MEQKGLKTPPPRDSSSAAEAKRPENAADEKLHKGGRRAQKKETASFETVSLCGR